MKKLTKTFTLLLLVLFITSCNKIFKPKLTEEQQEQQEQTEVDIPIANQEKTEIMTFKGIRLDVEGAYYTEFIDTKGKEIELIDGKNADELFEESGEDYIANKKLVGKKFKVTYQEQKSISDDDKILYGDSYLVINKLEHIDEVVKKNAQRETIYFGKNTLTGKVILKNLIHPVNGSVIKNAMVLKLPQKIRIKAGEDSDGEPDVITDEIEIYGNLDSNTNPNIKYKNLINKNVEITADISFAPSGNYPLLANITEDFEYKILK
jgi:hypothetical protein